MSKPSAEDDWSTRNLCTRVQVPGSKQDIELAQPRGPRGPGAITVLCGVNASGKTYLLKGIKATIARQLAGSSDSTGPRVSLVRPPEPGASRPKVMLFTSATINKEKSGRVDLGVNKSKLALPGDMVNYRLPMLDFFRRELARRFGVPTPSVQAWINDVALRVELAKRLALEDIVYATDATDPFVAGIEGVLGAQLYYRRATNEQVEFVKRGRDGVVQVYSRWSEGEKAVFFVIGMVLLGAPDIVLLDEIENHLHPALISSLLVFLRDHVPQALIATHHPHVIFSDWIDRVVYLDTRRPDRAVERPDTVTYDKSQPPAPGRRILSIEDDFDRLASTYALFSKQDKRLLEQAGLVHSSVVVEAANNLREVFTSAAPARPSSKPSPDRQTAMLLHWLRGSAATRPGPWRVLDIGAGVGRTAAESRKQGPWSPPVELEWWSWEPLPAVREQLRRETGALDQIRVIDDPREVEPGTCSVALLANVLHELTPPRAAEFIALAHDKVLGRGGVLLILELYPLLVPEQFAVPYPSYVLRQALGDVGLLCFDHDFSVRGSRAYQLVCRAAGPAGPELEAALRDRLELAWDQLLTDSVTQYTALTGVGDIETHRRYVSQMTTIASVVAWKRGRWRQD